MKRKIIPLGIIVSGMIIAIEILLVQVGNISAIADSFGFEKNIDARKSADKESVEGCMQSCGDMLAGWLEMNPDSNNYTRQGEKIEAKAEQCLAMNTLASLPFTESEILASCGLTVPHCVKVSPRDISLGSCTAISFIEEKNLPQCCGFEGPQGGRNCGVDEDWVVGVAAFPTCYIPGS